MRTTLWLASTLALLAVGCFSPTYHNGNLKCTASGECPEGYHCAVDHTCWHNGSDPDARALLPDTAGPDTTTAPESGADIRDAAPDGAPVTDLPIGVEVAVTDVPPPSDTAGSSARPGFPRAGHPARGRHGCASHRRASANGWPG